MLSYNTLIKILEKSYFLSQKYQNLIPIAIIIEKGIRVDNKSLFSPILGIDLQNSHLIITTSVLGYHPTKLIYEALYILSIDDIRMRFLELQDNNQKARKLKVEILLEGQKDIKEVFHYSGLLYILKIICFKLII